MRIRFFRHIILLFSFLSLGLFSHAGLKIETAISASSKVVLDIAKTPAPAPHSELDLVKHEVTTTCYHLVQKKLFTPAALQIEAGGHIPVPSESLFIKNSLLLIKTYLFCIYPFHHFW